MAINFTVNPATHVIFIPKSELTLVSGTLYTMDTDEFRLSLKAWEDDDQGIYQPKTHNHNTEVTIAGVVYARSIDILSPYSITFEDDQYSVILTGSNNNIWDIASGILNQNQVQVIPTNSAGLITVTSGSGVTSQDKTDIIDGVWDEAIADHTGVDTFGGELAMESDATTNAAAVIAQINANETKIDALQAELDNPDQFKTDVSGLALNSDIVFLKKIVTNKKALVKTGSVWELIIYDNDNSTPIVQKDLKDADGNNIGDLLAGALAQELQTSV